MYTRRNGRFIVAFPLSFFRLIVNCATNKQLRVAKTLNRLVLFGVGATFWLHHWWGAIETFVEKRIVKASEHHYRNAVSKVFIDQTIGAPIFNLAFFWSQSVLQGEDMSTAASTAVDRLPAVMKLHYCFWPWVHCVNFSFVGLHARLLVQNTLSVGWMAFLSNYRQRLDDGEEGLPEPESGASCSGPHHSRRPNTPTAKKTHVTAAAATATTSTTA